MLFQPKEKGYKKVVISDGCRLVDPDADVSHVDTTDFHFTG
jgi:hypothetical protein